MSQLGKRLANIARYRVICYSLPEMFAIEVRFFFLLLFLLLFGVGWAVIYIDRQRFREPLLRKVSMILRHQN